MSNHLFNADAPTAGFIRLRPPVLSRKGISSGRGTCTVDAKVCVESTRQVRPKNQTSLIQGTGLPGQQLPAPFFLLPHLKDVDVGFGDFAVWKYIFGVKNMTDERNVDTAIALNRYANMTTSLFDYPQLFSEKLQADPEIRAAVDSSLSGGADVLQVSKLPFFAGMFLAWTEPRGLSLVGAIVGTV